MFLKWDIHSFRQCLAGLIFMIDSIPSGAVINFSGTFLDQLGEEDSSIQITRNQGTWIASIASIGTIIATLVNVAVLQLFGRKWTYFLIHLSDAIFWGLLANSTEVWHIYTIRAILGFNTGLALATRFIFAVEIVDLKYRNPLLNLGNIGFTIGMLFVDIMGSYVRWQRTAYVLAGFGAVCAVLLLYLENTHVPYIQRGNFDKAAEQFFWYRKKTTENWEEFNSDKKIASVKVSFAELKDEWRRKEFLIPLGILFWFITSIQFTGALGMKMYSVEIMRKVVSINEYLAVIIADVMGILAAIGSLIIMEIITFRRLINCTSVICAVALFLVSLSLYLGDEWRGWSTVSVTAIWTFNFIVPLGHVNVFNVLYGTMYTGVGKTSGMALNGMFTNSLGFGIGHLLPALFDNFGMSGTFLFLGCCTVIGGTVLYFIVPEVKGKGSEEIRQMFANYNIRNIR